eukprot:sb/3479521/
MMTVKELEGKTVLVTGGNSGIGKPTALALAERGADVTIIGRNKETCEEAVKEIKAAAGHDNIRYFLVDLASFESIREFAEQFKKDKDRLDILVNNAGVVCPAFRKTKQYVDSTIGINYLGHFYLTLLLSKLKSKLSTLFLDFVLSSWISLDRLDNDLLFIITTDFNHRIPKLAHSSANILVASKARLVVVAMKSYEWGKLLLGRLEGDTCYPVPGVFKYLPEGTSVLVMNEKYDKGNRMRIEWMVEFAIRYPDVTAISLHPGWVNLIIVRDLSGCFGCCWTRLIEYLKLPEQGLITAIYELTNANKERENYLSSCRVKILKYKCIKEYVEEELRELVERLLRNRITCAEAVRDIKAASRNDSGDSNVRYFLVDLASFESIREFAEQFKKDKDRLDILVNNAGVINPPFSATKEGVDTTIGINYLGHFYLTMLLIDMLVASEARVVVLTSESHTRGPFHINWLEGSPLPRLFQPAGRENYKYAVSCKARIYLCKELSKRYPAITAVSVHPGCVDTNLSRDIHGCWGGFLRRMAKWFGKTPEQGAATSIYCATEASVERGEWYSNCRVRPYQNNIYYRQWYFDAIQEKLWEVTVRVICKVEPRFTASASCIALFDPASPQKEFEQNKSLRVDRLRIGQVRCRYH